MSCVIDKAVTCSSSFTSLPDGLTILHRRVCALRLRVLLLAVCCCCCCPTAPQSRARSHPAAGGPADAGALQAGARGDSRQAATSGGCELNRLSLDDCLRRRPVGSQSRQSEHRTSHSRSQGILIRVAPRGLCWLPSIAVALLAPIPQFDCITGGLACMLSFVGCTTWCLSFLLCLCR